MTPMIEAPLWNLMLRDFAVEDWRMVPVTGIKHNEALSVHLTEFADYGEALEGCELQRVFVEPRTEKYNPDTVWLHSFEHPRDCIYIFGSAHYNPTVFHKRDSDIVVSIKTVQDRGVLWSHQAAAIMLYDRWQ